MDPNVTTAPSAPPSTPSPRVINVTPASPASPSPSGWKNRKNLALGLIGALVLVLGLTTSLILIRRPPGQQVVITKAAGSFGLSCPNGNSVLVSHQFATQGECEKCEAGGCGPTLVGEEKTCGWPGTTCVGGGSDPPAVPNCSVAQFDCLNAPFSTHNADYTAPGIEAGSIAYNCGGCTPPPPPVDCQCHSVVADKDLSSIKIGDTVTFTGFGWVTSDTDAVDKINFIIKKDSTTLVDNQANTTRAPEKDSGGQRFWKATQSFTATDSGTYAVKIRVHWQSQNIWKE